MKKAIIPIFLAYSFCSNAQETLQDTTKTSNIEEVMVTALGIKRQAKSLTYSAQQIGGDELTEVKTPNFLNATNGKVSNVQINRTNGVGSSVRVLMRGNKSVSSSQPLYVIDGIPIINGAGKAPDISQYSSMPDSGDVLSSINPDDIESINFLKGASASALYGSAGGNGVILITTKKGRAGKSSISYSTSLTVDQAYSLPKLQHSYLSFDPSVAGQMPGETIESWGAKGSSNDYLKSFLQNGTTWVNSLSFQSGNEKSTNYFSLGNTTNKGIVPTSAFDQYNLSFRNSSKLLDDKLTLDANFIGSLQNSVNRQTPGASFNPLLSLYWLPRGVDFDKYTEDNYSYLNKDRLLPAQNWWEIGADGKFKGNPATQNPYWILNRNRVTSKNKNVYTSVSLAYQINPWLSARIRGNYSWVNSNTQRHISAYSDPNMLAGGNNGRLLQNIYETSSTYGDALLIGNPKLSDDFSLDFTLGGSISTTRNNVTQIDNSYLSAPNLFTANNLLWIGGSPRDGYHNIYYSRKQQVQSVFTSASVAYKEMLYVDMTFRNDWDSSLANSQAGGYDYESLGANAILTTIFKLPEPISFWKVRGSYATVGIGLPPNGTNTVENVNGTYTYIVDAGNIVYPTHSMVTDPNFSQLFPKAELNKTFEAGTELRLFKNKLSFDFTYYNSNATNQLLPLSISSNLGGLPSGSYYVNTGKIKNTGFESSLSYKVLTSEKFGWTTTLNGSKNKNTITELFPNSLNIDEKLLLSLSGGGNYTKLKLGGSFGDIYGFRYQRDDQGRILVDADGLPLATKEIGYLGNPNPKFMLGFANTFRIGRLDVSFLVDGKFGGQVLSLTEKANDLYGVSQTTGSSRDAGGVSIANAVYASGTPNAGASYTGLSDSKAYYGRVGGFNNNSGIDEAYIYSATTVRLRQASVAYTFDLDSRYMKNVSVSLIGTNLFFFYKKAPFDPEQVSGNTPGGVGVDSFGIPITRSVGLSLKANF